MGFCLFNNVAIAARHLRRCHRIDRIAVVDWDVHHGNGTQEAFWADPSVFYLSLHLWPFYPGTGAADETGSGQGEGTTVNVPLSFGVTAETYAKLFGEAVHAMFGAFKPQFLLISAGFDTYADDPLPGAGLDVADFRALTDTVTRLAARHCNGRIVSALEGGYSLDALPHCVAAHLDGLINGGQLQQEESP